MNKGETRYRITGHLTIQELTCMGKMDDKFVLHDQYGTECLMNTYNVDQLNISKVMVATELEEKLRHRLGQIQEYLRQHKQKFNPMDKPDIVYIMPNIREVHQYDLKGRYIQSFPSVKEAALFIGSNPTHSAIQKVCKRTGRYFSFKGFRWDYEKLKMLPAVEKWTALRKPK